MLILNRDDVRRALPMPDAITVVRRAFVELSTKQASVPPRIALRLEQHAGLTLIMPGHLTASDALAVKIVSVHQKNREARLPLIHALVVLLDPATGGPLAAIEGSTLTAIRTGAASGVATELLGRRDARVAAIFGAGTQARAQLLAVCAVRPMRRAWIFAPRAEQVQSFITDLKEATRGAVELIAATSPGQALREADIICAATTSQTPVFDGAELKVGAHVNGIGSFTPQMQEIDALTLARASKIVVDARDGALSEAGDILIALAQGAIQPGDIYGEIGEIAAGLKPGRESDPEITLFKSVGNAVQDVAVAQAIYRRALDQGLGTDVVL